MLPGSVSSGLPGSVSGGLPGSVSGSGSCDFVSGSGSCDFVSGSGSCDFVSGSGSDCLVSGPGPGSLVSDVSVTPLRQDVGFQKRRMRLTSNYGAAATHILSCRRRRWLAPGVVAGAGLANNLLEFKALISWKQFNSLSPSGGGAAA
jgi:hypothetical protein